MDLNLQPQEWERLEGCALFVGCDCARVRQLLAHPDCAVQLFDPGQILYQPHRFSRNLGILLSGSVQVTRDALVISVLSPGDLFGAAALFNDHPDYTTTLTARSPCRVVMLSQSLVSKLMDEDSCIRDNYIRYLSGRIRFLSGKVQALAAGGAEGKLSRYLLTSLSGDHPVLSCSATDLARRLGISRASLYRAFERLEAQGLIHRSGRSITVPDLGMLETCTL